MPHIRQDFSLCDAIAAEPIPDDFARLVLQAHQEASEKAYGRCGVTPLLHDDIEHYTVLVHHAPKIEELAVDLQIHLIRVPSVGRPRPPLAQPCREVGAEAAKAVARLGNASENPLPSLYAPPPSCSTTP
jgi:hypothetical protein